jgi:hypothetical protein
MKEKKRKKIRVNKILRPISVWLFILLLQIVLNFDSTCYLFNHSNYEQITAVVAEEKTDPYLLLIPMVKLEYNYNGQTYSQDKFFVLQPFFGLSSEKGTELPVYVNKLAPGYTIFKTGFFRNWINWLLMVISVCCLFRIGKLIREKIRNWKRRRRNKKEEKEGIE